MLKKIALLLLLIAPMSVFAQKFAHFKSMDIIPVMPEYTKAQTDIQALQKQYEDEIKRALMNSTKSLLNINKNRKLFHKISRNVVRKNYKNCLTKECSSSKMHSSSCKKLMQI